MLGVREGSVVVKEIPYFRVFPAASVEKLVSALLVASIQTEPLSFETVTARVVPAGTSAVHCGRTFPTLVPVLK